MELEGRLNPSLSLPEVLQFVSMGKMTGALTVVQGDYSVMLSLRQGRLINSTSLGRPRRLGQLLVAHGLVQRSALEELLQEQRKVDPPPLLGNMLVTSGLITVEQLRHAIRLQLEEEMWDLFSLQEGSFKFEHGAGQGTGEPLVELEVEPLIMEGSRRLDEWARIVRNLAGDHVTPCINVPPGGVDREAIQLTENEWRVLSLINGFYNMGSLAMRSGIGRFETYRVVNSFMAAGLVMACSDAPPSGPSPDQLDSAGASSGPGTSMSRSPAAASSAAANRPDRDATGSSSARLTALFRRSGLAADEDDVSEVANDDPPTRSLMGFVTYVGFIASLAAAVVRELMEMPDFTVGPLDRQLLAYHWRGVLMAYPKADLVKAHDNEIDASPFERFVEFSGTSGPIKPVYDDTLEALIRLMRMLYLVTAQRLGTRAAQRIVGEQLADHRQRARVASSEEFYFQDFADRILTG